MGVAYNNYIEISKQPYGFSMKYFGAFLTGTRDVKTSSSEDAYFQYFADVPPASQSFCRRRCPMSMGDPVTPLSIFHGFPLYRVPFTDCRLGG
jgi:hypothetical protein